MFGMQGSISSSAQRNAGNAGDTAAGYGAQAAGINANLLPFLTRELQNPEGFTQQQQGAMLNQAEAGAGGSTAGLTTEANLESARNRNSGGFSGALDQAARERDKALSATSSGIAANNANLQQQQKQAAASGLQGMQGMDMNAQLKAMGLQNEDLNTAASTYGTGSWASDLGKLAGTVGQIGSSFFPGGTAGKIFGGLAKM